jgi:hypothetical protein
MQGPGRQVGDGNQRFGHPAAERSGRGVLADRAQAAGVVVGVEGGARRAGVKDETVGAPGDGGVHQDVGEVRIIRIRFDDQRHRGHGL